MPSKLCSQHLLGVQVVTPLKSVCFASIDVSGDSAPLQASCIHPLFAQATMNEASCFLIHHHLGNFGSAHVTDRRRGVHSHRSLI